MTRVSSIFSQLLQLFSRLEFQSAVQAHKAERHARGFTCGGQFVAMVFCQLGRAQSLREICGGLAASEAKGQHAAPRDGPTYVIEDDRFFSENLIQPGESVTLRDTEPGAPNVACCINPLAEKSDPIAEYYLLFAQFADGSTFGDPAEARDALAIRETILRGLRELVQSYARHGEQAFLTEMKQQPPWSGTSIFAQIWTTYKEKGIDAAVKRAQQILAVAGSHEASIRQAPPNPAAVGKPFRH